MSTATPAPDSGQSAPAFQFIGGALAVDFVNTVGNRLEGPREYFGAGDDVRKWAAEAGLLEHGRRSQPRPCTPSELRRVIEAREHAYALLKAVSDGRPLPRGSVTWLNELMARVARQRRLVPSPRGLTWEPRPDLSLADLVIGAVVRDLVRLLVDPDRAPVAECADDRCGWLFLDQSRGARRKWCSMADCGNRAKARRHYRRASRVEALGSPDEP